MDGAEQPADDDEPRAREVVAAGLAVDDPARRWEQVRHHDFSLAPIAPPTIELHVEPEAWHLRSLAITEREIPGELISDLRQCAPQALLRDLHRPVRQFFAEREEVEGSKGLGAWRDAADLVRAARVLPERPDVGSSLHAMRDRRDERRALLAEPWQPLLDDAAPRRVVKLWGDD